MICMIVVHINEHVSIMFMGDRKRGALRLTENHLCHKLAELAQPILDKGKKPAIHVLYDLNLTPQWSPEVWITALSANNQKKFTRRKKAYPSKDGACKHDAQFFLLLSANLLFA